MPAKHAVITAYRPIRLLLGFSAVILVSLISWIAIRAVGPDSPVDQPTAADLPYQASPFSPFTSVSPLPPTSPGGAPPPVSGSPLPPGALPAPPGAPSTRVPSGLGRTTPAQTTSAGTTPARTATVTTSPRSGHAAFTATLTLGGSWDTGYVATVHVENTGTAAAAWTVTVTHENQPGLRLNPVWGATSEQNGDTFIFHGGALAAGATIDFGFQGNKETGPNARPAGCTIVSGSCRVS